MFVIIIISFLILFFCGIFFLKKNFFSLEFTIIISFGLIYILPLINPYAFKSWQTDTKFLVIIWISLIIVCLTVSYNGRLKISNIRHELKTKYISHIFILISIFFLYQIFNILKLNNFNVIQALVRNRISEYLDDAENFSDLTMKLISILQVFYLVLILYFYQKKSKLLGVLGYLNLLFFIILITHTRFILLSYLLMPVFYYNEYIKRIKFKALLFGILLAAFFLGFTNFVRTGVTDKFNVDNPIKMTLEQVDIKSVDTFYLVYDKIEKNQISFDYMQHYFIYLPMTFIPRQFWTGKPIVSYFWRLTKIVKGNYPGGKNNPVLTSTIFGEAYHQGGVIGMFLVFLMYGILARSYIYFIDKLDYMKPFIWVFLIHIPMDLRGGFSSLFISYLTMFLVVLMIKIFLFRKII
jgi:oligosaccharide repeat unit polymerase